MKKIFLMVGMPGSGKSYFISHNRNFFEGSVKVVSRDKIRFALLEDGDDYFAKEDDVWINFVREISDSLQNYDNTVVDATHLNKASRHKILNAVSRYLGNVEINAIFMDTCLAVALKQNAERTGRACVPPSALRRMSYQLTIPTKEEGFNNIYRVKRLGDNQYVENMDDE